MSPIQSRKHYVQVTPSIVASGAKANVSIADAKQNPDATIADEVQVGDTVRAVFIEMWISSDDAVQGSIVATLTLLPAATNMTYANSVALHNYVNKKNVFYVTQGLTGTVTGAPLPFLRGWFKIPKGKQRFGLGDKLVLTISGIGNGAHYCGQITYKSYS